VLLANFCVVLYDHWLKTRRVLVEGDKKRKTMRSDIVSVLFFLSSFFLLCTNCCFAQHFGLTTHKDTIYDNYFIGGVLDSVDISFSELSSTLPGGRIGALPVAYDFFLRHEGGALERPNFERRTMRFSAIPHLGFGAVFGNQATQIVHATYTHAFIDSTLLNIDYDKHQGNAFMRSSDFSHHNLHLQVERLYRKYSFRVQADYLSHKIGHNNGILADTMILFAPLAFVPTTKVDATSTVKMGNIHVEHFVNFLPHDSLRSMGIYVDNRIGGRNRKYLEVDPDLSQLYTSVLISSDSTNDQFQVVELINTAGIYSQSKKLFVQLGGQSRQWKYDNLGFYTTSSEVNMELNALFQSGRMLVSNRTNGNLLGAKGEWRNHSSFSLQLDRWSVLGEAAFSSLLPQVYQRNYHGNHLIYGQSFEQLKRQFRANIDMVFRYKYAKHFLDLFAKTAQLNDNYWFYNDHWRADTLKNIQSTSIGVRGATHVGSLHVSILGSYNVGDWMPDYLVSMRLFLQGKLFKARKLTAQLGVEGSYHTSYSLLEIIPLLDVYRLTTIATAQRSNVHFFGAFALQRFRFFFRLENIASTWTVPTQMLAVGYPIPTSQLRVGITWDFFN